MAKPVVDRLEQELDGQAEVVRINLMSRMGLDLARRYGVRASPTLLVFDGSGAVVYTEAGIPSQQAVLEAVSGLTERP
jgi:thiol-disulfide isomerase/thioredoxin